MSLKNFDKYKKKLLLIPSAYNSLVLGDVLPFIKMYKDEFDVCLISDLYNDSIVNKNDITYVKNGTEYAKYLIYTADYIIDAGSTNYSTKWSASQKRVSVWHGIPYKKMFTDFDPLYTSEALNYAMAYDLMLSPSKYYSENFLRNSMLYNGEILETTMPRLEPILKNNNPDDIKRLKVELGLPHDKKIMLYAPTFRDNKEFVSPCDFIALNKSLGEEWIIVTKAHYLNSFKNAQGITKDFTDYSNVNDLLLVCDLLVTDYSSLFFEYSLLEKKLILFQYDLEEYSSSRGFMFDIKDYVDEESIAYNFDQLNAICQKIGQGDLASNTKKLAETFYEHDNIEDLEELKSKLDFDSTELTHKDITFVVNELNQIGGIHNFITNLAKEFKKHYNCKINVVAIKDSNSQNKKFYKFDEENIFDIKATSERTNDLAQTIIKQTDGYIISCQFSAHLHFQRFFAGKNVIAMFHGDIKDVVDKKMYHWHLDAINGRKLRNYKRLLTLTPNNSKLLIKNVPSDQIKSVISSMENSIDFTNAKSLYSNSDIYVAVTRLDEDKNIFDLITLFKNQKLKSSIKLHVYGDGPLKDSFEKAVSDAGLSERIILKGYCDNKEEIYKDKQGLVFTSKSEGFPLIILEAAKFHIPTILFDSFTAAREVVGDVGKLVEYGDFDDFANTLNNPLEVNDESFNNYHNIYSNETIMYRWIDLFEQVDSTQNSIVKKLSLRNTRIVIKESFFTLKRKVSIFARNTIKNSIRRHIVNIRRSFQFYSKRLFLMKQPLVSVIIPYYYSGKTIGDTLKSLDRLKYKNIEIIIVNDGSDDYTPPQSQQIKYYKLDKNVGPGKVRNFGVEKAIGKYITFLDGDDKLNKYGLHFLVDYAEKNNLEVVSGITRRLNLSTNISHIWFPGIYNKTYINTRSNRHLLLSDVLATNKIYKLDTYKAKGMKFESGIYEDKLFTAQLYNKYDEIGIVNKDHYIWNFYGSDKSISSSLSLDNFRERIDKFCMIMLEVNEYYRLSYTSFLLNHDYQIYYNIFCTYSEDEQRVFFNEMRKVLLEWKEYFYTDYVNRIMGKALAKALIDNDFDRFKKIADLASTHYIEESKK